MSTVQGVIILEGADGSGKTTLARHLVKTYDAIYIHHGWSSTYDIGRRFLANLCRAERLVANGCLVVIDRCYLSSDAYGTVYRSQSDVPRRGRLLHRLALKMSALTVICQPPIATLIETHARLKKKRGEMYDDITDVALWFDKLVKPRNPVPGPRACYGDILIELGKNSPFWAHAVKYDWCKEGHDLGRVGRFLLERLTSLREQQHKAALKPTCWNIAGHELTARVLMVGDHPDPQMGMTLWPFITMEEHRGYYGWFAEQLNRAGILDERLLWTNACVYDSGQKVLPELLERFPWMGVVALGRLAERELDRLGCDSVLLLEHPKLRKSFETWPFGNYLDPLINLLKEGDRYGARLHEYE